MTSENKGRLNFRFVPFPFLSGGFCKTNKGYVFMASEQIQQQGRLLRLESFRTKRHIMCWVSSGSKLTCCGTHSQISILSKGPIYFFITMFTPTIGLKQPPIQ
jgi:hypothetical protein